MMIKKTLLSFLLCVSAIMAHSQGFQYLGTPSNTVVARGGLMADSAFYYGRRDTNFIPVRTGCVVQRPADNYFYCYQTVSAVTRWYKLTPTGGTGINITSDNVISSTGQTEQIIGQIFNKSSFSSLAGFTNNGTTVSVVSNHIQLTGGSPFTQSLDIDTNRVMESWVVSAKIRINSSGNGPGVGWRSTSSGGNYSVMCRFNPTDGTIDLFAGSFVQVKVSTQSLSYSLGDTIELTCSLNKTNLSGTVRNVTTNSEAFSIYYNYLFSSVVILPNTGRLAVYNNGGSYDIDSLSAWSDVVKNPQTILLGNSKLRGYTVTSIGYRVGDYLNDLTRSCVILSGPADRLQDMIKRYKETLLIAGVNTKIIIGGCSNNIRADEDSATYCHLYDSLVAIFVNAGCTVYNTTGFYEPGINQNPFRNHIYQTYPESLIIETLQPTSQPGLLDPDNIHLNDAGQIVVYNTIARAMKIVPENTTYAPGNTVIWNQNRYYQNAYFRLLGSMTLYNTDISTRINLVNGGNVSTFINRNIDHATNTSFDSYSRLGVAYAYVGLGAVTSSAGNNDFSVRAEQNLIFGGSGGTEYGRFIQSSGFFALGMTSTSYRLGINAGVSPLTAYYNSNDVNGTVMTVANQSNDRLYFGTGPNVISSAGANDAAMRTTNDVFIIGDNAGDRMFTLDHLDMTTYGSRHIKTIKSAINITLGNAQFYVFNGTTATWTLPAVSGSTGLTYVIKNQGSGILTVNANGGSNEIYTILAINTVAVNPGESLTIISDGTYFNRITQQ